MHGVDIIDWKLIGSCNLRCFHCYGPPKTEKALSLPLLYQIIERFAQLKPDWVVLTGGEPLTVKGIDEVMGRLTNIGAKIALSTNTSFFREYKGVIEQHVSSLNIPLDGSTPRIHSLSRDDESTYHTFFDVLKFYKENPINKPELLRVGTVYSATTRDDLVSIAQRLNPFAEIIDQWKIYELIDYEFQRNIRRPIIIEAGEFQQQTSGLLKHLGDSALASKVMFSPAQVRDKAYFMINPRGLVVIPTDIEGITYEISIGDILNDSLEIIIQRWNEQVNSSLYQVNHSHYDRKGKNVRLKNI